MRIPGNGDSHLTYCTNMHPGETWEQVRHGLQAYTLKIRERLCPGERFGVGLWLSDRASRELRHDVRMAEFRAFCEDHGLYVFTLNGSPFGGFHGRAVKEEVFRPDWRESARLEYTNRLADILNDLLPAGMQGSISTVPCSFKPFIRSEDEVRLMAENLARHAVHLARIRRRTGRLIRLGLEPEPLGFVETSDEAIAFFRRHLYTDGLRATMRHTGWSENEAFDCLRTHLGICYDTCHLALQYEEPWEVIERLAAAGIGISKLQISSAMKVRFGGPSSDVERVKSVFRQLERFVEPTYLHQVIERLPSGLRRYKDLDSALEAARREATPGRDVEREWRIHFHLPLFLPRVDLIGSTRDHIEGLLAHLGGAGGIPHLEIETYTWSVLPAAYRDLGLVEGVVREFGWVLGSLAEHGTCGLNGSAMSHALGSLCSPRHR